MSAPLILIALALIWWVSAGIYFRWARSYRRLRAGLPNTVGNWRCAWLAVGALPPRQWLAHAALGPFSALGAWLNDREDQ